MSGLDQIMKLLPQLTTVECAELIVRVRAFSQFAHNSSQLPLPLVPMKSPIRDDTDMVLDAIHRVLESLGVELLYPGMLRKVKAFPKFRDEKVPAIMKFVRAGVKTRVQQIALLNIGVLLLYQNMGQMGIAVSSRAILNHAHRIPSIINQAFPGYAANGMLGMLVRQYVKGRGTRQTESDHVRK